MNSFNLHYRSYKLYLKNLKFKNLKYKPLVSSLKRFGGGRNNNGRITVRHRGGGVKRLYKKICFNYYHLLNFKYSN